MSTQSRLNKVFKAAEQISFDDSSKIVLMSDCHRGDGNWGDNFLNNQNLFFGALDFYYRKDFTYIELGDGDELWENRKIDRIINIHSDAFWLMSKFYKEGRLYMLYGNHDQVKKEKDFAGNNLKSYYVESIKKRVALFPNIKIHEALVLNYNNSDNQIFLTHGHQADFLNYDLWKLSRFLVRYLWRPLELTGVRDPTSAAENYTKKEKVEKKLTEWTKKQKHMLIAGHTHRPMFPQPEESLYFNDGSCVHPRCITAIEIENGTITLVKWTVKTRKDRSLYVDKVILEGPVKLQDYFGAIAK
ncbi:metallophosphoesterase [Anaerocolumna sp. AGMB13025]|uniref:metallophosphoesterase n=1 Tax=Anaerocolumna sp. AGMB13025 TaxID=3039116 RepID=UPI00241DF4C6|nr:metallophosphoesterase [Anaerocolumna sp. AGMB13025]WFR58012.1 metallophosphoesterase [Anaerocolumna sp. AGMB13025]